jgi:3-oxoacyl-[acyl-carrier protein] reductase
VDLGISGRRAAVAAASEGLGLGAATALRAAGVHVAICGRDAAKVRAAAGRIGAAAIVCDVGSADGGAGFIASAAEALGGPIDIVVPNAGGPPMGGIETITAESVRAAMELNLMSTIGMCAAAIGPMQAQRWGRIVAITSITARQPIPAIALSNINRPAVTGYLKTLSLAVAADGVTVNSVQPGLHATSRMQAAGAKELPPPAGVPVGFWGDADDFGAVVAFLCSTHAKFITGVGLPVDGGAVAALQ